MLRLSCLSPAGSTCRFADAGEKLFNELGSLHLVELLHSQLKELLGQVFHVLLVELVVAYDAQDEPTLSFSAVPVISITIAGFGISVGTVAVAVPVTGVAIASGMTVAIAGTVHAVALGVGNKTDVLNLLVNRLLQEPV